MFNNPSPINPSFDEAVVTEIDVKRKVCRVKTLRGQNLNGVIWVGSFGGSGRGGDRGSPELGNRVFVTTALGFPLILGSLPKLQTIDNTFPMSIDDGSPSVETGNFTSEGVNAIGDQNSPKDMVVGDRILGSTGGGMVGVLRGGSVLLRSSRLAEVFITKWDDLVRVVSRNWEHFSDLHTDIIRNLKGRIYRYSGYAKNLANAKREEYTWHEYTGDTVAAEKVKADYQNGSVTDAVNGVMYKEQLKDGDLPETMHRTVHLDGTDETVVVNTRHTQKVDSHVLTWSEKNTVTINPDMIQATWNGENTITITDSHIFIDQRGKSTIELTDSMVKLQHGPSVAILDDSGIHYAYKGFFMTMNDGGIQIG